MQLLKSLKLKDLSLYIKLTTPLVLAFVVIASILAANFFKDLQLKKSEQQIIEKGVITTNKVRDLIGEFQNIDGLFYRYLINSSTGRLENGQEKMQSLKERAKKLNNQLETFISTYEGQQVTHIKGVKKQYEEIVIGNNDDGIYDVAIQLMDIDIGFVLKGIEAYTGIYSKYINGLNDVQAEAIKSAEETVEKSSKTIATYKMYTLLASALSAIFLFLVSMFISVRIIKSVKDIAETTEALSSGDVNVDIERLERGDELGRIVDTLELFQKGLIDKARMEQENAATEKRNKEEQRAAMNKIADEFDKHVGAIVKSVRTEANEMQTLSAQLSSLVEKTTQQSSSVNTAAHAASSNVETVADSAEKLSDSLQTTTKNISDTAFAAQTCAISADDTQHALTNLQTAVEEITAIVNQIKDIAGKTNLLALNATIEAARAGDAGRGFAVVAGEVRSLSSQTHEMTDAISESVGRIKATSGETIQSMQNIITQITDVDQKVADVSDEVKIQNDSTTSISRNVLEAAEGTANVSKNIGDIMQASEESAQSTAKLTTAADSLADQAQDLNTSVKAFLIKVRG